MRSLVKVSVLALGAAVLIAAGQALAKDTTAPEPVTAKGLRPAVAVGLWLRQ